VILPGAGVLPAINNNLVSLNKAVQPSAPVKHKKIKILKPVKPGLFKVRLIKNFF
jgi:hypothetical protein